MKTKVVPVSDPIAALRKQVAFDVADHISGRSLDVASPTESARRVVAKWSPARCRDFVARRKFPNLFVTHAQISDESNNTKEQAESFWKGYQTTKVILRDKSEVHLFRPEVELRFSGEGTCFHLACEKAMSHDRERVITDTTWKSTERHMGNWMGSAERQESSAAVNDNEKAGLRERRERLINGTVTGPQIGLFSTGTNGK